MSGDLARRSSFALLAGAASFGCGNSEPADPAWLVDVTEERGPHFVHEVGPERTYFMPELMGPGAALFDYDGDGDLDAYLLTAGPAPGVAWEGPMPPNRLYRQEHDGSFVDVTEGSGLESRGYGQGVAVGDHDNDGDLDVYVTNYGKSRLFRNRGDGSFEDVTDHAGVGDRSWSTSATFCDYDADGYLDLYVATYLVFEDRECTFPTGRRDFCSPTAFEGSPDSLYRNRGDGTFEDVTDASGIGALATKGLGVACADLTGDGRFDFFVANDQEANQLWVQGADGMFRDEAVVSGLAFDAAGNAEANMGVAVADLDGDLSFDLYVTHLRGQGNNAWLREGPVFRDATADLGLQTPTMPFTGFGVAAVDLEHDADLDLVIVNAHVYRATPEPGADRGAFWNDYAQPGLILLNGADGHMAEAGARAGSFGQVPEVGRGLARGDVDNDGDIDFLVGNTASRARLFLNEAPKAGRWIALRAHDRALGRDVHGAIVVVDAEGRKQIGRVDPTGSYLSSNDPRAHFGLGPIERVDSIEVVWPDGERERFGPLVPDREHVLVRGTGRPAGS